MKIDELCLGIYNYKRQKIHNYLNLILEINIYKKKQIKKMKKILLFLTSLIISISTFAQVKLNVWDKNPNVAKTINKKNPKSLPQKFESSLPNGGNEVYKKVNIKPISYETSDGKKWTSTPVVYHGTNNLSAITYSNDGWSGLVTKKNGEIFSMTPSKIINDTASKYQFNCSSIEPPSEVKKTETGRTTPTVERIPTSNFYNKTPSINKTLTVYIEVSYPLYLRFSSNTTSVQNYVNTLFANVALIYLNEGITIQLNKVHIWTTPDPYTDNASDQTLFAFQPNIMANVPTNPNAQFKHLLTDKNYGGIAFLPWGSSDGYTLTGQRFQPELGVAVSGIGSAPGFDPNPYVYNWPVNLFAHEMGHNLGSKHTHWCGWKNESGIAIGRLDSCGSGFNEQNTGPIQVCGTNSAGSAIPTIMSYCQLKGTTTNMLVNGFGKYPRFAMRSWIYNSPELPSDNAVPPTITTTSISSIQPSSAVSGGTITNDGGSVITLKGICWSTSPNPTVSLTTKSSQGGNSDPFSFTITNLNANTTYYVRAYAINSAGTSYGNEVTFTTPPPLIPTLTTVSPTSVSSTSASSGGSGIAPNGASITSRGVCWSTSPNPTIALATKTSNGTGTANFTSSITGLSPTTTYYLRAYATNSAGTGYGNELTFTTIAANSAVVTTFPVKYIGSNSATFEGEVVSSGQTVTQRGICWKTSPGPTTADSKLTSGTGLGIYGVDPPALIPNTTYYVRAYCISSAGTFYGSEVSFTTDKIPVLTVNSVTDIFSDRFTVNWSMNATDGGCIPDYSSGILSSGPLLMGGDLTTVVRDVKNQNSVNSGTYSTIVTNLSGSTVYNVKVGAMDCRFNDFRSSNTITVTTPQPTAPVCSTRNAVGKLLANKPFADVYGRVVTPNGTITESGFCYSTSPNPTTSNTKVTSIAPEIGNTGFQTGTIGPLIGNTTYYVRFFATNNVGLTGYGESISFVSLNDPAPKITIDSIRNISTKGARFYGKVVSQYNCDISGGCIQLGISSTNTNPTQQFFEVVGPTQTTIYLKPNKQVINGLFEIDFTAGNAYMQPNTLYYVKAFTQSAVTLNGIYNSFTGESVSTTFRTLTSVTSPSLTTTNVTGVTTNMATSGGNVTSEGGATVTSRGVVWNTSPSPTIALSTKTSNGTGSGSFTSSITGLTPGVTYYLRAYATNSVGTTYGSEIQFTTLVSATQPTVNTTSVTSITTTGAVTGGNVVSDGGQSVTARGICYSTSQNPTLSNSVITSGSGTGNFTSTISGLTQGTTYFVRAFATNSINTAYGTQVQFSTLNVPTVTTTTATSITSTTASSGGNVTSDGGSTITQRGIVYSTTPSPNLSSDKVISTTNGTGTFSSSLSQLLPGTTYYVRAYAQNAIGVAFGNEITFITSLEITLPTLTTTAVGAITTTSASSGGTITSDGNSTITQKGVVWSTSPSPTISLTTKTSNGTGTAAFTSSLTNLSPGLTYYIRSYATNSFGTGYGNELSFQTSTTTPTLGSTTIVSSITQTTAVSGGNITSDGGLSITARGIVWSTSQTPTISLTTKTNDGTGSGSFVSNLTNLTPGTLYYVRSYATNGNGTQYGTQVSFTTTSAVVIPTVTTTAASSITQTGATSGGNVTSAGGGAVSARGVIWSTSPNPTVNLTTKTSNGTGTGVFSSTLTGLLPSTTYYYIAYATNTAGTGYGNQLTLTTQANPPTVTTTTVSSITLTSAVSGGSITSDGGSPVLSKGVVWSTSQNPSINLPTKTNNGTGSTSFSSSITGLSQNTLYYVRAYATNASGTGYGPQVSFTTLNTTFPTVTTTSPTSVQFTSAISGGNVVSDGNSSVTGRGVVWSTTQNPTIGLPTKTNDGVGTGSFSSSITSLVPGTTYYVRAYATNSIGTNYGSEFSFNTTPGVSPTLTTDNVTNITSTNANVTLTIVSIGGGSLVEKGFVYSTTPTPTTADTKIGGACNQITNPCDVGQYTLQFSTSLTPATTYYVRAYAINQFGTSYGQEISFTTTFNLPSLTTAIVSNITTTTAVSGGADINAGGGTILEKGVVWSTSQNPTINLPTKTNNGGGTGLFTSNITGLNPGTLYYVRAYATNGAGTSYGNQISFTTTSVALPTLTTNSVTSITTTSASCGGNISSDGGSAVTSRGVVWSTSQNPTIADSKTIDGTGIGSFLSTITGLSPGTLYYIRAYATTLSGTAYGGQQQFTTTGSVPTLSTTTISSITSSSAVSGGFITSTGGNAITNRGVVWSTSQNPTIALSTKTSEGAGTVGTFVSSITGLSPSTTYYVRAYATNSSGTGYGTQLSFTTTSSGGGGSCGVSNIIVQRTGSPCTGACTPTNTLKCPYTFSFNVNPNCTSYTVQVCRYDNTNPAVSPIAGQRPAACAVRNNMSSYVPTPSEISAGVITRTMSPVPANGCTWYSVDVTCNNCNGVIGNNVTTRSAYFYNAP